MGQHIHEHARRYCQLDRRKTFFSLIERPPRPRLAGTRHRLPLDERLASEQAVVSRSKEVAADPEEVVDDSMHRRKMLQMGG